MSLGLTTPALVSSPASRLSTLPSWGWDPFDPAAPRTLGYHAARWAETWLIQPNGPRAGKPFRLTAGQLRWLLWWYALDDDAQWLYGHGVRRLAKGSGKSPLAAVQCLIEFTGDCRLDRFDDREPGGCVARPENMPLVQIAATAESQTANTMRMVRALAPKGSKVVSGFHLDPGKTRYYKLPEGTLEIITSSATAAEGAESSFVIGDQTERWKPSNGGADLAATLADNLAKSGARMVETPNAWVPGAESVAEASWDAWLAQEEGRTADERSILYDARMAPPGTDLTDPESLRTSLEAVYADCDWKKPQPEAPPDVRPLMKRIWSLTAKPDDSKRKYLNWPTASKFAWTTREEWSLLAAGKHDNPARTVQPGEPIGLFFDGSKSRDTTALIGCCVSDGFVFVPRWAGGRTIWEPDRAHNSDDVVPVDEVDMAVDEVFESYDVQGFFGDVAEWESFTKIEWPKRHADKLLVKSVPLGKDPQTIAWDMRGHVLEFTRAAELTLAEITDRGFLHDDDPVLARHVTNMDRDPNRHGVSVCKRTDEHKIDGGVCMIGARMVRRLVLNSGKRRRSSTARQGVVL